MRYASPLLSSLLALAAVAGADQRDFGFQPLEIHKFENGTSRLAVTDINGDGLDDILFANNHVSRLEILVRKPDAGTGTDLPDLDEQFENKGLIVDQSLKALRVADLNGNGRQDIITFGTAIGLQIRYQQDDGSFADPERVFIKDNASVVTIQIGDLNGNGRQDILVCRRNQADLHWNSDPRPFHDKKTLTFSADKSFYGDIADINRDGIVDLAFHFNTTRNPLRIRYGKGGGFFGTEQPIDLPPRQYMDILQPAGAAPHIGMVLRNRLAYRTYRFVEKEQPPLFDTQEVFPKRIGLEGTSKRAAPAWLVSDFNADGYDDLLVAAPELSRLHLYSGGADGLDPEPRRIDTLSAVTRISRRRGLLRVTIADSDDDKSRLEDLLRIFRGAGVAGQKVASLGLANSQAEWSRFYWSVFLFIGLTPVVIKVFHNYTLEMAPPSEHTRTPFIVTSTA